MSEIIKQKIQDIFDQFLDKLDSLIDVDSIDFTDDEVEKIKSCQSKAGQDKKLTKEVKV